MKILWFSGTPSLYEQGSHPYHGVGWIDSLETLVRQRGGIELAVSFLHKTDNGRIEKGHSIYYPIKKKSPFSNPVRWITDNHRGRLENEDYYIPKLLNVVKDFKPDLIHIFGTEGIFALIQGHIKTPIVIHLQGLLNPIQKAFFPPATSKRDFIGFHFSKDYLLGSTVANGYKRYCNMAKREERYFSDAKYLMGRTDWDRNFSLLMAPQANYFHIDEVLRPQFYILKKEKYKKGKPIKIVSILSPSIYKGFDVILKTVELLKKTTSIDFVWQIAGIDKNAKRLKYFEKKLKIKNTENNIFWLGKQSPENLSKLLLSADLFVHPSYIDNSPNSVCEAQMLGLPVIACNVGGLPTLIENNRTGLLIPSNGIYELVNIIMDYERNPEKYYNYGKRAHEKAEQRHDRSVIIEKLVDSYQQILKLNTSG